MSISGNILFQISLDSRDDALRTFYMQMQERNLYFQLEFKISSRLKILADTIAPKYTVTSLMATFPDTLNHVFNEMTLSWSLQAC